MPWGGVGDEDLFAGLAFAAGLVVGADHQKAGHLAVGACEWRKTDGPCAGNLGEEILEAVHDGQGALYGLGRLERVNLREAREPGHLFVPLGVVFHGAASEGIEAAIDPEVQLAQAGEVADKVQLPDFRYVQLAAKEIVLW